MTQASQAKNDLIRPQYLMDINTNLLLICPNCLPGNTVSFTTNGVWCWNRRNRRLFPNVLADGSLTQDWRWFPTLGNERQRYWIKAIRNSSHYGGHNAGDGKHRSGDEMRRILLHSTETILIWSSMFYCYRFELHMFPVKFSGDIDSSINVSPMIKR